MFIRGKPIRFAYRVWMMCSNNGYPYNMEIYEGKSASLNKPLGSMVVNNFLSSCGKNPLEIEAFFDNFLTSYNLLCELGEKDIKARGTIRDNRTKKRTLIDSKIIKKESRRDFDIQSDEKICMCPLE
ncbi:hypothetical protein PR048_022738 [Dryococelus australis]|uniref:PiggyBac transposable element-derived protein domain-containing protein n=1 Tax=Dryococelus australis TaxID=614101 RepID=A0ABQ9GS36_9NEOP|nr:hypothetical protein PR048_022738 [Dryococelus australis]